MDKNEKKIEKLKAKTMKKLLKYKAAYWEIPAELQNDNNFMQEAFEILIKEFQKNDSSYDYIIALEKFFKFVNKNDKELILELARKNITQHAKYKSESCSVSKFLSNELKNNKDFMLEFLEIEPNSVAYASKELKNDEEYMKKAISKDENLLAFASEELCAKEDFMMFAIKTIGNRSIHVGHWDYSPFYFASKELQDNKDFVLEAMDYNDSVFYDISERLKDDIDVIYKGVEKNAGIIKKAGRRFRYTVPEVVKAVLKNPRAIDYVEDKIIKEVVEMINNAEEKIVEEEKE